MENRLIVKLIVGTESMFFLALIMAYVYFSAHSGFKPVQSANLDLHATAIFSLFLFSSSFTYWCAESSALKGRMNQVKGWLLLTIILGLIFLFGQGHEYEKLLHNDVTVSSSIFGTSFYTLTGFHGLHVVIGLIAIGILAGLVFSGNYDPTRSSFISALGIYWHFVDIVWLFVFSVVYVLPHLNSLL